LIDGSGGATVAGRAMIVEDGRITWLGRSAELKIPRGATMLDLSGKYVMPGIINLHGHVGNTVGLKQDPGAYGVESIQADLRKYASYGVTTVLSLGMDRDAIFEVRSSQHPGMARVFTAGRGFTVAGGAGATPGVTYQITGASEVEADVAELARQKVDIVKMWVDDNQGKGKKMAPELSHAVIANAHAHGLRVAAHIFYLADAKDLVDAGLDALAHSVRDHEVDQDLIGNMKRRGVWQMASTLTREYSVFVYAKTPPFANDPFFLRGVSPETAGTLASPEYQKRFTSDPGFLEMAKRNLKKLFDAGVNVGFGTDTGPPGRFQGYFEHLELEFMVDAGLTPAQAIAAATSKGAEFLHAKDLGTLAVGKWADLLVLDRNPLDDIRNTRSLRDVYIAGERVN
jgi:imidazolonepropionase-like amidohydrolase